MPKVFSVEFGNHKRNYVADAMSST